jgi:hypothetical protein
MFQVPRDYLEMNPDDPTLNKAMKKLEKQHVKEN